MKKILFLIIYLNFLSLSSAEVVSKDDFVQRDEWRYFSESTSGRKFYTKGISFEGNIFEYWMKSTLDKDICKNQQKSLSAEHIFEQGACEIGNMQTGYTVITNGEINCKTKKYKILSQISYGKNEEVIEASDIPSKYMSIYPDTIINSLKNEVCEMLKK